MARPGLEPDKGQTGLLQAKEEKSDEMVDHMTGSTKDTCARDLCDGVFAARGQVRATSRQQVGHGGR